MASIIDFPFGMTFGQYITIVILFTLIVALSYIVAIPSNTTRNIIHGAIISITIIYICRFIWPDTFTSWFFDYDSDTTIDDVILFYGFAIASFRMFIIRKNWVWKSHNELGEKIPIVVLQILDIDPHPMEEEFVNNDLANLSAYELRSETRVIENMAMILFPVAIFLLGFVFPIFEVSFFTLTNEFIVVSVALFIAIAVSVVTAIAKDKHAIGKNLDQYTKTVYNSYMKDKATGIFDFNVIDASDLSYENRIQKEAQKLRLRKMYATLFSTIATLEKNGAYPTSICLKDTIDIIDANNPKTASIITNSVESNMRSADSSFVCKDKLTFELNPVADTEINNALLNNLYREIKDVEKVQNSTRLAAILKWLLFFIVVVLAMWFLTDVGVGAMVASIIPFAVLGIVKSVKTKRYCEIYPNDFECL